MTRAPELERTRREGKRVRTGSFEVRVVASLHALSRVGIIVPKHRHSSVERNRVKRRLRELLRLELMPVLRSLPLPLDVVLRASALAYDRSYAQLSGEMQQTIKRLTPVVATLARDLTPAPSPVRSDLRADDRSTGDVPPDQASDDVR